MLLIDFLNKMAKNKNGNAVIQAEPKKPSEIDSPIYLSQLSLLTL